MSNGMMSAAVECFTSLANTLSPSTFLDAASSRVRSFRYCSNALDPNTLDTIDFWGTILGHDFMLLLQYLN
ncbi:hypothetical protein ACJIZ3_013208 [Penstemon smallii]|uniref:Pectinesterase inhibitor domain-containing protein n=1 Tax=Penstemon smallii TaxID=265156 RepID=A0ABD3UJ34_9LAMI